MAKLDISPSQAGYAFEPGKEYVNIRLEGGKDYRRKTKENSTTTVDVSWTVDAYEYAVFWAFFRKELDRGVSTFTVDLTLEDRGTVEVTAAFINPPRLVAREGDTFTISGQLEAVLPDEVADADTAILLLHGIYGENTGAWLNRLEQLMNVDIAVLEA